MPSINDRIELSDLPRDRLNQLAGLRQKLVQARNSARFSPSKAQKLKETLAFLAESLEEPVEAVEDDPVVQVPSAPVEPVEKPKGARRATAKVKASEV